MTIVDKQLGVCLTGAQSEPDLKPQPDKHLAVQRKHSFMEKIKPEKSHSHWEVRADKTLTHKHFYSLCYRADLCCQ